LEDLGGTGKLEFDLRCGGFGFAVGYL
jgi:hypothetical protein